MVSSIMNGDDLFTVFFDSQLEFMMMEWWRDAFSQFWRVGDAFFQSLQFCLVQRIEIGSQGSGSHGR